MEEPESPSEQDILVSRLVARIAELEERLYAKELETQGRNSVNILKLLRAHIHIAQAFNFAWLVVSI